jgi:hypothetical protein
MIKQYIKEFDENIELIKQDKQLFKEMNETSKVSIDKLLKKQENLEKQVEKCINNIKLSKNRVRFFDDIDGFKTAKKIRRRLNKHLHNTVNND